MNTQRAPATCGPLPFPGCAGRSGRRLHPRRAVGRPSSCPFPSARPCDRAAPAPRLSSPPGAAGASSVSMLPGPTPGLSKVSGLNKDRVCSMKMHQIHVLKTTESWLMSAKGCGNNTRAVLASFKSQSGPSAQSQLRSLPGRLSVQPGPFHRLFLPRRMEGTSRNKGSNACVQGLCPPESCELCGDPQIKCGFQMVNDC